jgi:hypothetical protein
MRELYELSKDKQEKCIFFLKTDPWFRKQFFENRLYSFALWYFPHFFTIKSSDYHKQIYKDLLDDRNLMLISFREFWKSIITLVAIIHSIVYKKFNFWLYFSYEQRLSASRLFDIIVQLKTNQLLIRDYWQMFPDNKTKEDDWLQKKSVSEFITTNGIKLKAMSIWTTARWLVYANKKWAYRPDRLFLDDIDVIESVRNPEIINKNEEFLLNEVIGWVDDNCKTIFLWNVISWDWLVPRFEAKARQSNKWILHKIPIKIEWKIVWDRFVETNQEAQEWADKWIKKISLEKKKEEQGEFYKPNFELIPSIRIWNPVFDIDKIRELKSLEYKVDPRYKELRIYKDPCETIFWLDSSSWSKDWDYSTIVWYNKNKELVLTFQWRLAPDLLWECLEYIFSLWYKWLIIPENNSIWISLIDKLKNWPCKNYLYFEKAVDKITARPTMKYWFNTNSKTKPLIISKLEENIRKWEIIEFDERVKDELVNFYYNDIWWMEALKGLHDDLVIWTALSLFWINQPKKIIFS